MHRLIEVLAIVRRLNCKNLMIKKTIFFLAGWLLVGSAYAMEPVAAVRLLQQATFGPTNAEINKLANMSAEDWIDEQLAKPMTLHRSFHPVGQEYPRQNFVRVQAWLKAAIHGEDQIRQRMAFALSQIFVVSELGTRMKDKQEGLVSYYDTLVAGALGNYSDLMFNVTMHPVMGTYLTYSPNFRAFHPNEADENYARELLQLMSVGPYLLNLDGSYKLDSRGKPIDTYSPVQIKGFAKVFTGLCYTRRCDVRFGDYVNPMHEEHGHDLSEKILLTTTLPAHPPSSGKGTAIIDIKAAIRDIMAHPNVGPFVSHRLIQMLVTSNPTPQYIARVATVFNDNGNGVKGDLAAVVKAILLDGEARGGHIGENAKVFGKLREPLLALTHYYRAVDAFEDGGAPTRGFYNLERGLHQAPLMAPSVFNFYHFDYGNPRLSQGFTGNGNQLLEPPSGTRIISLESSNYPGYFVRHDGSEVRISDVGVDSDAALWKVVPGLAGGNTFSLESVDLPGHFLRHRRGRVMLDPVQETQLYKEDASWLWQDGIVDSTALSLESVNYSNEYIRHSAYLLVRTPLDTELHRNDATFVVKDAVDKNPGASKARLAFPEFELSPEDKLINRLNFVSENVANNFGAYIRMAERVKAAPTRAEGVKNLIDHIDLMFTQGDMTTALRDQIDYIIRMNRLQGSNAKVPDHLVTTDHNAIRDVMILLFTSPEFAIQR